MNPQPDTSTPRILAFIIFAVIAGIVVGLFLRDIPSNNKDMLMTVVQSLLIVLTGAAGFYWGSSVSSQSRQPSTPAAMVPPLSPPTTKE